MAIAVKFQSLTKRYSNVLAVDHIDFTVHLGEFFGFLGLNGAGKTTTINMLTGVTKATSGKASILGHNIGAEVKIGLKHHVKRVFSIDTLI